MADILIKKKKKKSKVKKEFTGYYFDGEVSWKMYKTSTGHELMIKDNDKEKKNVH
jgi:hypothetical protein|tara:strand:- start:85 stop:249 length:165 start_codon:yes stop_codon:yes gene_type:complete